MMRVSRRIILASIASAIIPAAVGCTSFSGGEPKTQDSMFSSFSWFSKKEKPPEPYPNPVKLVATWSPDTLIQSGRTPTRGFGGRLYFYNEKSQAVPVDGTLVVHGFDEHTSDPEGQMKRFAFTPEQFTQHFSQSDLGASYSVWIPWDAVGGEQRKISLVATFMTEDGKSVQGVPTTVMLPGRRPDAEQQLADKLAPEYRRWQQVASGNTGQSSGLTTTTIQRPATSGGSNPTNLLEPTTSGSGKSMMAGGSATPSGEIRTATRPKSSTILPTSGETPLQR